MNKNEIIQYAIIAIIIIAVIVFLEDSEKKRYPHKYIQ